MLSYWFTWLVVTILKGGILAGSIVGAVGGILDFNSYALLAILFISLSLFFLYDFIQQLLVPLIGGEGYRLGKPSDTPVYMGLAPPFREARKLLAQGGCIIWE